MSEMPISKREARRALVIPTLPILIFVMALLLLSILVSLVLSLVVSFRLGDMMARPNPFNNYELVWPGRTLDDVAEYAARSPKGHINCYATTPTANEYPGVLLLVFQST